MSTKPTVYMLVGVPGSGKSTWMRNQIWVNDLIVVSTDDYIEMVASNVNMTYNDVFDSSIKPATAHMMSMVENARDDDRSIVWDQTNTTKKSRWNKLKMLPNYHKIAVFFKTPELEELNQRLASRAGKNIPEHVMKSMIENLEIPTVEEGFDEVWMAA